MKFLRLFVLLFIFFVQQFSILSAQNKERFQSGLFVGGGGGATFSRFIFIPSVRQHTNNQFLGGITIRYDVENHASLQVEINYERSGWSERFDDENGNNDPKVKYIRNLDYIRVPVLTYLYMGTDKYRIFAVAGPEYGYQVQEKSISEGQSKMNTFAISRHQMPTKYKISWGLTGGIGTSFKVWGNNRLELEGRFTYGFGDIWSTRRIDPYGQASEIITAIKLSYLFKVL